MKDAPKSIEYRFRTPQLAEIPEVMALFAEEVKAGRMLPRKLNEMQAGINNWRVAYTQDKIIGCVSLVYFSPTLCEIRSLAVATDFRNNGLGKKLISEALKLAKSSGAKSVLTLTRSPSLFEQLGFQLNTIENFPEKVMQDCYPCPLIDKCDEIALLYKMEENGTNT